MPDPHQHSPLFTPGTDDERDHESPRPVYRIMQRGSYYNILGPRGRVFGSYKSASVVGPRWEELTETPWPYQSRAYESGHRLWELGLIPREDIGKTELTAQLALPEPAPPKADKPAPRRRPRPPAPAQSDPPLQAELPLANVTLLIPTATMALPAPRIDTGVQDRLMQALQRDPGLLFDPPIKQALHYEVEYHRPHARWASHLLTLLARYEQREHVRAQMNARHEHSDAIMEKHIAWQEQRLAAQARRADAGQGAGS